MPDKKLSSSEIAANRSDMAGIRAWLKYRGHNQRFIAEALGVSDATVSKWLSGKQSMTVAQFRQIAGLLDATPEELMAGPEQRARSSRYQRLASLAARMTDDQLQALEVVAAQIVPPEDQRTE